MSKHKAKKVKHTVIHPTAEKVGALVLTAISVLVTFETLIEHNPKFARVHEASSSANLAEVYVRAETRGEAGRLPEEFDIGMQTPRIAGL
jgi:hypothetical protein